MGRWTDYFGVTSDQVADNSLTAADLGPNSVNTSELAAESVGTSELQDGAVTAAKLAPGVTGSKSIYLDTNDGDDGNEGYSPSTAVATIAAAEALCSDGDVLYIHRGSVIAENHDFSGKVLTIKAYGAGTGPRFTAKAAVSSVSSVSGIVYSGQITMDGAPGAGNGYFGLFVGGERLRELDASDGAVDQASAVALIQANPGTCWQGDATQAAPWSDTDTLTYYFSMPDSSAATAYTGPITAYQRISVFTNLAGEVHDCILDGGWGHNGVEGVRLVNSTIVNPARHGCLITQSHENSSVFGNNPKATGGCVHTNPVGLQDDLVWRGMMVVQDAAVGRGNGFYTHGAGVDPVRTNQYLIDCKAVGVGSAMNFEHVDNVYAIRFETRDVYQAVAANGVACKNWVLVDCDMRGGQMVSDESGQSLIGMAVEGTYTIRGSYLDSSGQQLFYGLGGDVTNVDIDRSLMVLRCEDVAVGNSQMFYVNGGDLVTLTIKNSYLVADTASRLRYIARAAGFSTVDIDETLVVGTYDNTLQVRDGASDTALSDLNQAGNRVLSIGYSRVVDTDDENGLTFKLGTWSPGMYIFSGATYTDDADNPRATVMVGDIIVYRDGLDDGLMVYEPSNHLNDVAWVIGTVDEYYVAVGEDGLIVRSDNGKAWTEIRAASGAQENLNAIASADIVQSDIMIAVGDNGELLRSTDAGATWGAVTSNTSEDLLAVASDGAGNWIAVGRAGVVCNSTDDGATWSAGSAGTSNFEWHAAYYSHEISKFLIGGKDFFANEGNIYSSNASPISWVGSESVTGNTIVDFDEHADANTIVAVCYQSGPDDTCILYSEDGAFWEPSPQNVPFQIKAICGPGSDDVYNNAGFIVVGESQYGAFGRGGRDLFDVRLLTEPQMLARTKTRTLSDYLKEVPA